MNCLDCGGAECICTLKRTNLELVAALREAVQQCGCSVRERDSGHRVECFAPRSIDLLLKLGDEALPSG